MDPHEEYLTLMQAKRSMNQLFGNDMCLLARLKLLHAQQYLDDQASEIMRLLVEEDAPTV